MAKPKSKKGKSKSKKVATKKVAAKVKTQDVASPASPASVAPNKKSVIKNILRSRKSITEDKPSLRKALQAVN